MSKEQIGDLLKFLAAFETEARKMVLWLREFVWDLFPNANELIYVNYNALAFGWSPTNRVGHTFCSIAVFRTNGNVHFGIYWGSEISDPKKLLIGNGKNYRYILVKTKEDSPKTYVKKLLKDAYTNSLGKVKDENQFMKGNSITKSISSAKRKPVNESKK